MIHPKVIKKKKKIHPKTWNHKTNAKRINPKLLITPKL